MVVENRPNTQRFIEKIEEVSVMYQEAYKGDPWNEDLTYVEVYNRVQKDIARDTFEAFTAETPEGKVVGALWFDEISLDRLEQERGENLAVFAKNLSEQTGVTTAVWERDLMVKPDHQGQHIGTRLRVAFNAYLAEKYPEGVMLLTRMRDDNPGTIRSAEKLGYQKTGVRIQSSKWPDLYHDYWYKIIAPQAGNLDE